MVYVRVLFRHKEEQDPVFVCLSPLHLCLFANSWTCVRLLSFDLGPESTDDDPLKNSRQDTQRWEKKSMWTRRQGWDIRSHRLEAAWQNTQVEQARPLRDLGMDSSLPTPVFLTFDPRTERKHLSYFGLQIYDLVCVCSKVWIQCFLGRNKIVVYRMCSFHGYLGKGDRYPHS